MVTVISNYQNLQCRHLKFLMIKVRLGEVSEVLAKQVIKRKECTCGGVIDNQGKEIPSESCAQKIRQW